MNFFDRLTGEGIEQFGHLAMGLVGRVAWLMTILLVVVWVVRRFIDDQPASRRRSLWIGVAVLTPCLPLLVLPIHAAFSPLIPLDFIPAYTASPIGSAFTAEVSSAHSELTTNPFPGMAAPLPPDVSRESSRTWTWLLGAYFSIVAFFLARVAGGHARIWRWIRSARPTDDPRTLELLGEVCVKLDQRRPVRLVERAFIGSPIAVGIFKPTLLVPLNFHRKLDDQGLAATLAHEVAHLKNRDPLVLLGCSILKAFFFFHPLVWMVSRRVSQSIEFVGDEAAVQVSGDPVAYAKALHRFSSIFAPTDSAGTRGFPMMTPKVASLSTRVQAILAPSRPNPETRRGYGAILQLAAVALAATTLGWAFPLTEKDSLSALIPDAKVGSSSATTLTVGPTGTHRTIASALEAASPGDTLRFVGGGVYTEDLLVSIPLTFVGEASNPPKLSGTMQVVVRDGFFAARNLTFAGSVAHGLEIVSSTGTRIVVDACGFIENQGSGIFIDSSRIDFRLSNSRFISNAAQGLLLGADARNLVPQPSDIRIEKCEFRNNGRRYPTNSSHRGRGIQIDSIRGGHVEIVDTNVFVTEEGHCDRGIHFDSTRLIDYTLVLRNCLVESPGYQATDPSDNFLAIGLKIKSSPHTIVVDGCRIRGFKHSAEFKTRELPTDIRITNSEFVGFTSGRGIIFQGLSGKIAVDRVVLIGHDGRDDNPTGDEALRIKQCYEFTADIRNVVAGNTEEGITIDQCSEVQNVTISSVVLYRGAGRGEQGIKVQSNETAFVSIRDALIDDYQTGLDCFKTGFDQTLHLETSKIQATRNGVIARGEMGESRGNSLLLNRCVLIGITDVLDSTGVSIEDEGCASAVTLSNCTLHGFGFGVSTDSLSAMRISVNRTIFSEWSDYAIRHRSAARLDEDRNVFVASAGSSAFSPSPSLVRGRESVVTDQPTAVFANLNPESPGFLRVLGGGLATQVGGSRPVGALDPTYEAEIDPSFSPRGRHHTLSFLANSIADWLPDKSTWAFGDAGRTMIVAQGLKLWEAPLLPIPEEVTFIREHFAFT